MPRTRRHDRTLEPSANQHSTHMQTPPETPGPEARYVCGTHDRDFQLHAKDGRHYRVQSKLQHEQWSMIAVRDTRTLLYLQRSRTVYGTDQASILLASSASLDELLRSIKSITNADTSSCRVVGVNNLFSVQMLCIVPPNTERFNFLSQCMLAVR